MRDYLYSLKNRGMKLGLERIQRLAEVLGSPQKEFKSILVGGTCGKGSTVAMVSSILKEAGFKVGTYTSPHLSSLTERIAVNGERISEEEMEGMVDRIKDAIERMKDKPGFEHPTFFEVVTAAALCYFKEKKVDFAVLEVGLGGRLDATNITPAVVSVITNVSLEHTNILGDTVEEIAEEKGGIIKRNGVLVTGARGEALDALEDICRSRNARIIRVGKDISFARLAASTEGQEFNAALPDREYKRLRLSLLGRHQLENAACAIGAVHELGVNVSEDGVRKGLMGVRWAGRLEIMQQEPLVVLDCAKDAEAMKRLREAMESDFPHRRLILVLSISSDKDIQAMVDEIVPISDSVVVAAHKVMGRAAEPKVIAEAAARYQKELVIVEDVKDAVKKALSIAQKGDAVLVTGSLFTVAEARELWDEGASDRELNEAPNTVYKSSGQI